MNKYIETCKKIIEDGGCRDMRLICPECPLDKLCKGFGDSVRAAKQYLKENSDMEWKELDINNLPHDILVGDYEFEYIIGPELFPSKNQDYQGRINMLKSKAPNIRYRKDQPKTPSHTEIMTKWWKCDVRSIWAKVESVEFDMIGAKYRFYYTTSKGFQRAVDLIGRESADIPPEGV